MRSFKLVGLAIAVIGSLWFTAPAAALEFQQPSGSPYSTGENTVNSIRTGDFNEDGRDDVFTANADYSASVFLAGANGSMSPAPGSPIPSVSYVISGNLGDFNGDGHLDLVGATNDAVEVRLGNGDGTFNAAITSVTNVDGADVAVADFNHDGKQDLVVAGYSTDQYELLLGNGDGTFTEAAGPLAGNGPIRIVVADFNRDGYADFATANLNVSAGVPPLAGAVTVLLNDGDGTFSQPSGSPYPGYFQPRGIAAGDFNGDADPDLAVVSRSDRSLLLLYGGGDGTFSQSGNAPDINSQWGNGAASADFNTDGFDDVLVGMSSNLSDPLVNSAPIFMGASSGDLVASPDGPWPTTSPSYPWEVATGDFNDDGHADWVSGDQGGRVSVFMNEAPALTASPVSLSFAGETVGSTSAPSTVTLTSSGIGPVTIPDGGVTISGLHPGEYSIDSEDCESQVLDNGETCEIDVTFHPTATGTRSATLEVAHDAAGSPTTVIPPATISVTPGSRWTTIPLPRSSRSEVPVRRHSRSTACRLLVPAPTSSKSTARIAPGPRSSREKAARW
jgi:hypothetical protein